jgi:hypothetical protein
MSTPESDSTLTKVWRSSLGAQSLPINLHREQGVHLRDGHRPRLAQRADGQLGECRDIPADLPVPLGAADRQPQERPASLDRVGGGDAPAPASWDEAYNPAPDRDAARRRQQLAALRALPHGRTR